MGALIFAIIAGVVPVFPFSTEETAYAQTNRPDDATLSGLTVDGTGVTGFAVGTTEYTARVINTTNVVTIVPVTNNPDATYNIRPGDADGSTDDHDVSLRAGQNTRITITVTAEDRRTRLTYTLTVYRDRSTPSDNANLSALSLDGVSLSPRFSSGTTKYNARVRYDVMTVTVAATAADDGARGIGVVVVPPGTDDEDDDVYPLDGRAMETVITVTVMPEDTNAENKSYAITVYRESGPVLSDAATLSSLTVNGTAVEGFASSTTEYTTRSNIDAPNDFVTIGAAATGAPGATVRIIPADQIADDPDVTGSTGHQVYLTPGTNTPITVTVTAENRSTNTYTITVYRERINPSSDATLSALSLAGVSLSPAFDSEKTAYNARVRYNVEEVTVVATAADIGAEDLVVAVDTTEDEDKVVSLGLPGTTTVIAVTVTAENGSTTTPSYMIMVYRESGPVLSDDATLVGQEGGLALTGGAVAVGLTPGFAPDITEYTASVENTVEFVTVTAAADTEAEPNPGARVDIMPADQNSLTDAVHEVYLTAGVRTAITVTVTAENGSTNTYTVTVYRKRAPATASSDATLSALSLAEVTLSPAFDSATTAYNARVRYDVSEVTITATTADIGALAPVSGTATVGDVDVTDIVNVNNNVVTLGDQGTDTVITVAVAAESDDPNANADAPGAVRESYKITVYRENIVLSDNATLAAVDDDISVTGLNLGTTVTLSPTPFVPGTNEYTARAPNATDFVTVVANSADDPGAMVDIMPADQNSLETPAGHQVYLTAGANTAITVTVTAEDGSTNIYTFLVYRERNPASPDAKLSMLSLSGVTLSPPFDPDKMVYIGRAANSTELTTVSYTADIGAQSVDIENADAAGQAIEDADNDPSNGHQVPLNKGLATVIYVNVSAESDDPDVLADALGAVRESYKITVYRDAEASSDATLQTLDLSGITLSPAFDPATTAYTAEAEDIVTTTIEAMTAHPGATVEGTGEMSLTAGENVIMVKVTAEDDTSQTYTVTVTVLMEDTQTLLDRYDINPENGRIDKSEVLAAINDYIFDETITRDQVLEVINLYIFR